MEDTVWTSFSRGTRICHHLRNEILGGVNFNQDYGRYGDTYIAAAETKLVYEVSYVPTPTGY